MERRPAKSSANRRSPGSSPLLERHRNRPDHAVENEYGKAGRIIGKADDDAYLVAEDRHRFGHNMQPFQQVIEVTFTTEDYGKTQYLDRHGDERRQKNGRKQDEAPSRAHPGD